MNVLFMVSFPLLLVRLPIDSFVNRQKTRLDENFFANLSEFHSCASISERPWKNDNARAVD